MGGGLSFPVGDNWSPGIRFCPIGEYLHGLVAPVHDRASTAYCQQSMGGVYQGLGGLSLPMKPRTFRHASVEGIAIITCSMVDEHLTIKVICC